MNKVSTIKITLQSDLCVGSGYSYAGVIDSDVTSDHYGFPYIPARRLKGCMKEAAEMIRVVLGQDTITELFGDRGQKAPGRLTIGNARIANYAALTAAAGTPAFRKAYTKDAILQQFSTVRAQTMILPDGTAKENTLRFIRVINQATPLAQSDQPQDLTFYAEVRYPAEYENDLAMIAQATRSIGMNRNRGLGNVHCELDVKGARTTAPVAAPVGADDAQVEIRYTLINEEPLMISQDSDNVSETYIPGRMILGALAANYLSGPDAQAEDAAFRDLFLDGSRTQFLNAYITDARGARCIPAPGYIHRLKKTRHLVNYERVYEAPKAKDAGVDPADLSEYRVDGGNQPKRLKGQYCSIDAQHTIQVQETERQLVYHHRHKHGDDDVQLYSHLEVSEGQRFAGIIRTSTQYQDLVIALLEQGIHIGKSRGAQYGKCVVEITGKEPQAADRVQVHKGDEILISFSAPAVFTENGQETVDYRAVYDQVAADLHIDDKVDAAEREPDGQNPFGIIETRMIYGYQSVWNLRRTPVAAVAEGSVLVYRMAADAEIDRHALVGTMHLEGYGEIHVENMADMPYRLRETKEGDMDSASTVAADQLPIELQMLVGRIERRRRIDEHMTQIRSDEVQRILAPITAAALGRITLMLREAREFSKDPMEQYQNYLDRIHSIKTKDLAERAERYARHCNPQHLGDLRDAWSLIGLEGLTCQKYNKKGEA